jgi:hypothetical protein
MSLGFAQWAMLWGLVGVAIPVIIHLLNRRRAIVIDWGAMQFLELSRRAQRKFQISELALLLGRMVLLGLVAFALARPFWQPNDVIASTETAGQRRDVVVIIDGSDSMERRTGGTTPRSLALKWLQTFVKRLGPGDSVGLLLARDRVQPVIDPPSFDIALVQSALKALPPSRGSSDLPAAISEAFRLLEKTHNPSREIVVLGDGQRLAWRPGETERWALLRELHSRLTVKPRIWSMMFAGSGQVEGADGVVASLELSRGLVSPNLPISVSTTISNAGPDPLSRSIELLVDGVVEPGTARTIGPLPKGGKTPVTFRVALSTPGSHVISVRLASDDDPLAVNNRADKPIDVVTALPVLIVDGEPGNEPFTGESDFIRAALSPQDDDTPQVKTTAIRDQAAFDAKSLVGQKVLILANIERLDPGQIAAVGEFLGNGGGVLIAPGDQTDAEFANSALFQKGLGWLPARLAGQKGDFAARKSIAHPAPRSFSGAMAAFGESDAAPLREANLFAFWRLEPAMISPAASVAARLDAGDPWIVERPFRQGRVMLLAGPLDAEGGTLPVNPDFVPWIHELVYSLADSSRKSRTISPGDPILFDVSTTADIAPATVRVEIPSGAMKSAKAERISTGLRVRLDESTELGIYRFDLPDPLGAKYVAVAADAREADATELAPTEAMRLAQGWPLRFETDGARLSTQLLTSSQRGPTELWRYLVLAALGGLCVEVWLTRRLVRTRGIAP